ncbi:MAG: glycosyltransferase [Pseudomonadota bacterium]
MGQRLRDARVLIYSHDSYGLGHLRRCRVIAHQLVRSFKGLSVLIITGSPIIGRFDFAARVDFIRIPGVIKLYNGDYTSLAMHIDIQQTLKIRESIIYHTAETFQPDLFIVDKEPLGLQGEVLRTLQALRDTACKTVLGLREVLDETEKLSAEWNKKHVYDHIDLYDNIWIYGPTEMGNPMAGLPVPDAVMQKARHTGYLRRAVSPKSRLASTPFERYILVTPGGGGDGEDMCRAVIDAYVNAGDRLALPAVVVLGPFMPQKIRRALQRIARGHPRLHVLSFDNNLEGLMANSHAVVAMGGYNTYCEILSLDKPALIVPRKVPRLEQFIRASRSADLGLTQMLEPELLHDREAVVSALQHLHTQASPSKTGMPRGYLSGLNWISRETSKLLKGTRSGAPA